MYLKSLSIKNYRKYGEDEQDNELKNLVSSRGDKK